MSAFSPLFSISISHDFYRSGECVGLNFMPAPSVGSLMKNSGVVLKHTRSGITLFYDADNLEPLQQMLRDDGEAISFDFKVYSKNREFRGFTAPFSGEPDQLLFFSNQKLRSSSSEKINLHSGNHVSEENLSTKDAESVSKALNEKDTLMLPPLCVIKIAPLAGKYGLFNKKLEPQFKRYAIRFRAKETAWKYYLLGEFAREELSILDQQNNIEFESVGKTVLMDGHEAATFISKRPIPFKERYNFNLQLREGQKRGGKLLVRNLPVARVGQVGSEVIAGEKVVVSEIYVNS